MLLARRYKKEQYRNAFIMRLEEKNTPTALLLLVALAIIPWLGLTPFYSRGEGREALVAQAMFTSSDYVLPRGYSDAVPSKPPLLHWLTSIASLPFGEVNEFSVRLPSALAALATTLFFCLALSGALSPRARACFVLLLAFSFEWLRASVSARVDMVHASSLASGLLAAFFALEAGGIRWWLLATLLCGLATLGKGPVALVIPGIVLGSWILSLGRTFFIRRSLQIGVMLTGALLIALPWYFLAYSRSPDAFLQRFWYENVSRFTSSMEDAPHSHAFPYLFGVLLLGTAPWSLLLVPYWARRIPRTRSACREMWVTLPSIIRYSLVAAVMITVFYCIPDSKRGVYLLAAYPFLAILGAVSLEKVAWFTVQRIAQIGLAATILVSLAQGIALPYFIAPRSSEQILGTILREGNPDHRRICSYGFEFYGAAFYSHEKFFRLEGDPVESGNKFLLCNEGDPLVAPTDKLSTMDGILRSHSLRFELESRTNLGTMEVAIGRLKKAEKTN